MGTVNICSAKCWGDPSTISGSKKRRHQEKNGKLECKFLGIMVSFFNKFVDNLPKITDFRKNKKGYRAL